VTVLEPRSVPPPVLAAAVDVRPPADPYEVYLESLESPESRRTMRGALDRIAQILTGNPEETGAGKPWWGLRYEHVAHVKAALVGHRDDRHPDGYSPTHINKHLIALRRVLYTCWRLGLMSAEDYQRAAAVKNVKGSREPAGRSIHEDELVALLEACARKRGPAALRDAALLAVLYSTGVRRAELAGMRVERYDPVERTIRVRGKGNKERAVPLMRDAVGPVQAWLNVLGVRRGPMFPRINKAGRIGRDPMSPRAVGYVVDSTRRAAGLPPLSTHDFRRTFIGNFLDSGGDLVLAQRIAGHARADTTARYDRRPERRMRDAVDRMSLPLPQAGAVQQIMDPPGDEDSCA